MSPTYDGAEAATRRDAGEAQGESRWASFSRPDWAPNADNGCVISSTHRFSKIRLNEMLLTSVPAAALAVGSSGNSGKRAASFEHKTECRKANR